MNSRRSSGITPLMPSGTLDVINEWSQERFDEPIIEDEGEDLIVHADLVLEEA